MRIGLLQCDHVAQRYRSIAGDYDVMVRAMLREEGPSLISYDVRLGGMPSGPSECDAYIISGSASSVYDDEQWIRDLETFIRLASRESVPMFGICFGLHAMATAFGGKVECSERGWGVGVHAMHVDHHRPWMDPNKDVIALIMSHQDQVVTLPDGAELLGSSDHCQNNFVEFTPTCIGVQGHPEFQAAYARALYGGRMERLGDRFDPAMVSLRSRTDSATIVAWMRAMFTYPTVARF